MKKTFVISIFLCFSFLGISQNNSPSNNQMQELVHDQLRERLSIDVAVLLIFPIDEELLFWGYFEFNIQEKLKTYQLKHENRPIAKKNFIGEELLKEINFNFIPSLQNNETLLLKAKRDGKYLYDLKFAKKDRFESIEIESYDKKFKKEIKYDNDKLKFIHIKNSMNDVIVQNKELNDSASVTLEFDVLAKRYRTSESIYKNGLLKTKRTYKKSKDKKSKKLKKVSNYTYDNNGMLLSEKILNANLKEIDSMKYYYNGSKLIAIKKQNNGIAKSVFYKYKEDRIIKKIFKAKDQVGNIEIEVTYTYNLQGLINSVDIRKNNFTSSEKYFLEYDQDSLLVSIRVANYNRELEKIFYEEQFTFDYNEDNILKSISQFNQKGKLENKIEYEIHKLSK